LHIEVKIFIIFFYFKDIVEQSKKDADEEDFLIDDKLNDEQKKILGIV